MIWAGGFELYGLDISKYYLYEMRRRKDLEFNFVMKNLDSNFDFRNSEKNFDLHPPDFCMV